MKTAQIPTRKTASGFTLVEILVSVSVLGLMMIGVAQMLNSAMSATLGGYRHMDADTQARMVLDRMAFDISKISRRTDVDYYFQKNAGNDQMAFFSEAGGYYPTTTTTQQSTFSLVGYRINGGNQLERLSKGLIWNGVNNSATPMVFGPTIGGNPTIPTEWPTVTGSNTDPDYQVIGDQVFRLEYCFLVESSYSNNSSLTVTSANLSSTPYVAPNTTYNGLQDVVAVVVSIAVLDTQSQNLATSVNSTAMTTAAADLQDVTGATIAANQLPLTVWKSNLATTNLGLPNAAASQVRFYQRYCYLNRLQ